MYASGPETSSSPRLFLGKKQNKQQQKWILCSFLKTPFYCPFPICSLHFIKTPDCVNSYYISHFYLDAIRFKGKQKETPPSPKSCPVTLIYFPFHSSLLLIISKFVYTHLRNVLEPMTCCPFFSSCSQCQVLYDHVITPFGVCVNVFFPTRFVIMYDLLSSSPI